MFVSSDREHPAEGRKAVGRFERYRETTMQNLFARFVKCESGATAIEYGLIASLIGVAIITAVTSVGTGVTKTFTTVSGSLVQ